MSRGRSYIVVHRAREPGSGREPLQALRDVVRSMNSFISKIISTRAFTSSTHYISCYGRQRVHAGACSYARSWCSLRELQLRASNGSITGSNLINS